MAQGQLGNLDFIDKEKIAAEVGSKTCPPASSLLPQTKDAKGKQLTSSFSQCRNPAPNCLACHGKYGTWHGLSVAATSRLVSCCNFKAQLLWTTVSRPVVRLQLSWVAHEVVSQRLIIESRSI
jgi:hypothetical protein